MRRATLIFAALLGFLCTNHFVMADDNVNQETTDETEVTEIELTQEQEEMGTVIMTIKSLGWCADENYTETQDSDNLDDTNVNRGYADERIQDLCERIKELNNVQNQLDENTQELFDNAKAMHENEQSLENRTLSATGAGTVGTGGMMAAQAYAEQKADEAAERDMTAYLETFRCEYGGGKSFKGSTAEIILPGGNELLDYFREYKSLADNIKAKKKLLGLRPGLESEILYDKAQTGLYQYASVGKTGGAYISLARALSNPESTDATAWNTQKTETAENLEKGKNMAKIGLITTAVANYVLNHDKRDRSEDILAKRRTIKSSYDDLVTTLIAECNETIQKHKEVVASLPEEVFANPELQEYRQNVQSAQPITTIEELSGSKFCK